MGKCGNVVSLLVVILSIAGYMLYLNQDKAFESIVNRSFNTFGYGVLCVEHANNSSYIQRFGKQANSVQECTASIILHNPTLFYRTLVISGPRIGLGEAYFLGYWSVPQDANVGYDKDLLSNTIYHFMRNKLRRSGSNAIKGLLMEYLLAVKSWYEFVRSVPFMQKLRHSQAEDRKSISYHYDIGNDFYQSFLGADLVAYSCGIFNDTSFSKTSEQSVYDAQINKWNIIMKKAQINYNEDKEDKLNILDIGCGWGFFPSFINNLTNNYVVGISISEQQVEFMKNKYFHQISNGQILFDELDYRELYNKYGANYFDRAVSIGMLEHVGFHNLNEYFQSIWDVLKPGSYFLLHYIIRTDIHSNWQEESRSQACVGSNFVSRYIFPNGCLVSSDWVWEEADKVGFMKLHQELFGLHYAKTLNNWRETFHKNWEKLIQKNPKYDMKLYKTYEFYFAFCESSFRVGRADLVQQLFYKPYNTDQSGFTNKWDAEKIVNPNKI